MTHPVLDKAGFFRILSFESIPCEVYFNRERGVTLSVGKLNGFYWLKASKHFYIKAMETRGDGSIYSRLQEITKFMEYLKRNLPEFHCVVYYISGITPRIALGSFRAVGRLQRLFEEYEWVRGQLGDEAVEGEMLRNLELLKHAGTHDIAVRWMESTLELRRRLRERLSKLEAELRGAASILNEWVEKGYAIALVWTVSTSIHICGEEGFPETLSRVLDEIERVDKFSVRARAYQQGLWIEEVREPAYIFYAEYCGLLHPSVQKVYAEYPVLRDFARAVEDWFNARLAYPIRRTGYSEESSTAVAEALAAFLRQVEKVEEIPRRVEARVPLRRFKKPVYLGLVAVKGGDGFRITDTPFMIELDELTKHCLISGATGSGKTRIAQIIAETSSLHVPTIIIDPVGELTGLIKENRDAAKEREFKLDRGFAYSFAKIYTLDDTGIRFGANLLKKPEASGEFLVANADETALILSELAGDLRFRDIFRDVLLGFWRAGETPGFQEFMDAVRSKARDRRIVAKLDRLIPYRILMSGEGFRVEELLGNKLSIFSLNTPLYSDTSKLVIVWFVLREILNYFLAQPHSDELKALVIVDEVHRFYEQGMPSGASRVLENMVKMGRGKGLGVVLATQSIKDLSETLTQANLRILLRILEGEIQQYGLKFGLDLARTLHSLEPRLGCIYYGNKRFFCKFRPTLSMPKGIEDVEEIRRHSMPEKMVEAFKRQIAVRKADEKIELEGKEKPALSDLSPDELRVINALVESGGVCRSKRRLQLKLGFGREKIIRLVDSLEAKGYVETEKFGSSVIVKLSKKVATAKPKR